MVRRHYKEQIRIVAAGGDPMGVTFADAAPVELVAGNYVIDDDTDLSVVPIAETLDS